MKKVNNAVLENRHNKLSEIWWNVLSFMQFHNPEDCFWTFYPRRSPNNNFSCTKEPLLVKTIKLTARVDYSSTANCWTKRFEGYLELFVIYQHSYLFFPHDFSRNSQRCSCETLVGKQWSRAGPINLPRGLGNFTKIWSVYVGHKNSNTQNE